MNDKDDSLQLKWQKDFNRMIEPTQDELSTLGDRVRKLEINDGKSEVKLNAILGLLVPVVVGVVVMVIKIFAGV